MSIKDRAYMPIANAIKEAADTISVKTPSSWNNEETTAMFHREGAKVLIKEKLANRFSLIMDQIGKMDFPFGTELSGILDQSRYNIGRIYVGRYEQNGKNLHLYETSVKALKKLLDAAEEVVHQEKKLEHIREEIGRPLTFYGIDTL